MNKIEDKQNEHEIVVDIPVVFEKANVVFNLGHLEFAGDVPVGLNYMRQLAKKFRETNNKGQLVGIFHGDAAYMPLNDEAYNAFRKVITGNPYKELLADLIKQGVQIEECVVSMKNHAWENKDLLPGVKVSAGAIGRIIQLTQAGYVQIQP